MERRTYGIENTWNMEWRTHVHIERYLDTKSEQSVSSVVDSRKLCALQWPFNSRADVCSHATQSVHQVPLYYSRCVVRSSQHLC